MLNRRYSSTLAGLALAATLGFGAAANATVILDPAAPTGDGLASTSDVTLGGTDADFAAGFFDLGRYNPTTEGAKLNELTDPDGWIFIGKAEKSGDTATGNLNGISISLSNVSVGSVFGSWTLSWADSNGSAPSNLPLYIDIAVGFKAGAGPSGGGIGYYFFSDELLTNGPYTKDGTFDLGVLNKDLSHESLWVRIGKDDPVPPAVPEPATMSLLGLGLAGLGALRRRKKAA